MKHVLFTSRLGAGWLYSFWDTSRANVFLADCVADKLAAEIIGADKADRLKNGKESEMGDGFTSYYLGFGA